MCDNKWSLFPNESPSAFPAAVLVIAGDADPVGRQKALEAAEAVQGKAVFPDFGEVIPYVE